MAVNLFGERILKAETHEKKMKMYYYEINLSNTVSKNLKWNDRGVNFGF